MQFEVIRLSLIERAQLSAFETRTKDGKRLSREEWIRKIFSEEIVFRRREADFHYVPDDDGTTKKIIIGRIGRQIRIKEHEPPEDGLAETTRPSWQASYVFIDPRHHDDGQKVAIERHARVGSPFPLFKALVDHVNHVNPDSRYVLEALPISDVSDFWDFVRDNKNDIASVSFEFVVPNMFSSADELDKEVRELRDENRARKAKVTLESEDGLEIETNGIRGAAEYAARGGGSIKARTRPPLRRKFNSNDSIERVYIETGGTDAKLSTLDLLERVFFAIFRL